MEPEIQSAGSPTSGSDEIELRLADRLRNLGLTPNQTNALLPLIEAVSNGLHAVEDRFGSDRIDSGIVTVAVIYASDRITGFQVSDNGVGLNEANYRSFLRADSPHKLVRGGKGVGRLTWLKAFETARILSRYSDAGGVKQLTFRFSGSTTKPITEKSLVDSDGQNVGTTVTLNRYKAEFLAKLPIREDVIAKEIVRHFLTYMIAERHPRILFEGNHITGDLRELYVKEVKTEETVRLSVNLEDNGSIEVIIRHLLLDRSIKDPDANHNNYFLCANARPVQREGLDSTLGLGVIDEKYVYVGLVSSVVLDEAVNQERTRFSMDHNEMRIIQEAVMDSVRMFLAPQISVLREEQVAVVERVIVDNPRFLTVARDPKDFAARLRLSQANPEEIYVQLSREHFRLQRGIRRRFSEAYDRGEIDAAFETAQAEFMTFVTKDTAHTLAEYVVRRRAVIEALDKSRRFRSAEDPTREYEEAIHNFICPLRSTTDDLDYDDHNLWILDDRLAFYSYFQSDRQIGQITAVSNSTDEPDITFFDLSLGFRRESTRAPIVIIEFKRPSRTTGYDREDPVRQLMRYVRKLRAGQIAVDKDGVELGEITADTQFHGIIVADLNNQLRQSLEATFVKRKTPDGDGVFGYDEDSRTYIEVVPYSKLLRDAKARNEAFFVKLGIN